jgi:hypothetical protein
MPAGLLKIGKSGDAKLARFFYKDVTGLLATSSALLRPVLSSAAMNSLPL